MNTQLTEIAFILDRSGSMGSQLEPAISGFNRFLRDQQETPGEARFTLVLFDDRYEVPCNAIPIAEVVDLDTTTFVPRGSTALLDAIGRTIEELGARLSATPEAERPAQVIVAILTDGHENASHEFSLRKVSDLIAQQRDVYKWQFFFLGADQDAIATAATMNIDANSSMRFSSSAQGFRSSSRSISRKMSAMRKQATNQSMTVQETQDLKSSLSDIGDEEDRKDQKK
jgi:hypothetical protein